VPRHAMDACDPRSVRVRCSATCCARGGSGRR
jgi:hypothetical protein